MTDPEMSDRELASLRALLKESHPPIADDRLRRRLLDDFDSFRRRKMARFDLASLADAFGWRALSRPFAPVGMLAGLMTAGLALGLVSANSGVAAADPAMLYAAAAFDAAFLPIEEPPAWVEP